MPQPITVPINRLRCQIWGAVAGLVGGGLGLLAADKQADATNDATDLQKKFLQPQLQAQNRFLPAYLNSANKYLNSPGNTVEARLAKLNSQYGQSLKTAEGKLQSNLQDRGLGRADATTLGPLYAEYAKNLATAQSEEPRKKAMEDTAFLGSLFGQNSGTALSNLASLSSQSAERAEARNEQMYSGLGGLASTLSQLWSMGKTTPTILANPYNIPAGFGGGIYQPRTNSGLME